MKIIELTDSLEKGGAEKFLVELSNELSNNNEVIICSVRRHSERQISSIKIDEKVKIIFMNNKNKLSFLLFFRLFFLIKRIKPEVVHIHSSILVFYCFLLSGMFKRILFVQTIHNTLTPGYIKLMKYLNILRFINRNFINICISNRIYSDYVKKYPKLIFRQIDNGIAPIEKSQKFSKIKSEISKLKKSNKDKIFIAIGNYSVFKNFRMLVNAFNELRKFRNDLILLILGIGVGNNVYNFEEIKRIKQDNIYQLGFIDNVSDYLFLADALVVSSTMEGMPLVILESLCAGLPVISTPAGGIPDIVEYGSNGFISEDFTQESFLKEINKFLSLSIIDINIIKNNNRKKFKELYDIKYCCNKYLDLFYACIK